MADIRDDFILGMDLISQHGLTIEADANVVRFGTEEFVLNNFYGKASHVKLIVSHTVKVPANSELIVPASLMFDPGYTIGLIQPIPDIKQPLLVASSIVRMNHDIPLRVANVLSTPVILNKGEIIAECEPITKIINCEEEEYRPLPVENIQGLNTDWSHLTHTEYEKARHFIQMHGQIFTSNDIRTGTTPFVRHRINTADAQPIRQRPRRLPLSKQQETSALVNKMLQDGIIEESNSPWSSPVVLVTKKDGSTRFCVDYRKLNDVTKKDSYPLPRIDDTISTLAGSAWFSTLDLKNGYWQVGIHPNDKEKTAFSTVIESNRIL